MVAQRLPAASTPFIGRVDELNEIGRRLADPTCRLLTLIGLGGIGKTRLAVQAAADSMERFSDSVYFIPVVTITSPDLLVPTIADILEVPLRAQEEPKRQLFDFLRDKHLLLVIDNFEHLLQGAGLLAEFLDVAPRLKILITSRERLNLQEEWVLEVRGLDIADYGTVGAVVEQSSAFQLFVHMAHRADADFVLSEADVPFVAGICQIVEGMPLAIELSASWVRVLSCQEILQEIEGSIGFLSTQVRNMPERHRSIRAVFEQSWKLLSADEKAVLRRLAVFCGGFTRNAAAQIAAVSLIMLGALVDKSVLHRNAAGRYEMHELLRQYLEEQVDAQSQEKETVLNLHCQYYADFLHRTWAYLHGPQQKETLAEIEAEIANIRAAWLRAAEAHQTEQIRKSLDALWYFYAVKLWNHEAEAVFSAAEKTLRTIPAAEQTQTVLAQVLVRLAWFCRDREQAKAYLEESVEILRRGNTPRELAVARYVQYAKVFGQAPNQIAKGYLQESLSLYQTVRERWGMAACLRSLGFLALHEADYGVAERYLRDSLALSEELGDQRGISQSLCDLANIAIYRGRYVEARPLLQKRLAVFNELGDQYSISTTLNDLGMVAFSLGDYQQAKQKYEASLSLGKDLGHDWLTFLRTHLSRTCTALGDYEAAREHYQAGLGYPTGPAPRAWCHMAGGHLALAQGNYREAQQRFEESVRLLTGLDDPRSLAYARAYLGAATTAAQDYPAAKQLLQDSLSVFRAVSDAWGIAYCLVYLGKTLRVLGEYPDAQESFREALNITAETRILSLTLDGLSGVARLVADEGGNEAALELVLFVMRHQAASYSTKEEARRLYAALSVEFTSDQLIAVQVRAQKIDVDEVVREVMAIDPQRPLRHGGREDRPRESYPARTHPGRVSANSQIINPLSQREAEVLQLMAAGLSNSEIAQQLVVAVSTVKVHARNIYGKLGARNRAEAIARAKEAQLL